MLTYFYHHRHLHIMNRPLLSDILSVSVQEIGWVNVDGSSAGRGGVVIIIIMNELLVWNK